MTICSLVSHILLPFPDNEPPRISNCPDSVVIPVVSSSSRVLHSWSPPAVSDNSGNVDAAFACLATPSTDCNDGAGTFSVGVTKVMYDATDRSGNRDVCEFTITITGKCGFGLLMSDSYDHVA